MEKKKEKADNREALRRDLEEQKRMNEERWKAEDDARRKEEEEQKRQEMLQQKRIQAERDKQQKEYEKVKHTIQEIDSGDIDTTITDSGEGTGDGASSAVSRFVDFIKEKRTVSMEELGSAFQMTAPDAVDRVKSLHASRALTGVLDDRGKFVYFSMEEMMQMREAIVQKGRISIADLTSICNTILEEEEEKERLKRQQEREREEREEAEREIAGEKSKGEEEEEE
jgi:hypothetical protein